MPAQLTNAQIILEWDRRVKAQMDTGKTRQQAIRAVVISDPAFHRGQYLPAFDAEQRARRASRR